MDPLQLLSILSVTVGLALLVIGVNRVKVTRKAGAIAELYGETDDLEGDESIPMEALALRLLRPAKRNFGDIGRRFTPKGQLEKMRRNVTLSGMGAGGFEALLAIKAMGAAVGATLVPLILTLAGLDLGLLLAIPGAILGFMAPDVWVSRKGRQRQEEIRKALPETIDLLAIAVQAGMGLEAAFELVSQSVPGPLGDECYRLLQEIQLGSGRKQALQQLRDRTEVQELSSFALALIQADAVGSPIADVLHSNAARMRLLRRQAARETAAKLPVKLLFPMLFLIFPALMMVVIGPAALSIIEKFSG
ncbi:MAG: type II secretion system F family protein [Actinomycetota bacterium]